MNVATNVDISYKRQSSGEYYIFVDGKFYCSSDDYHELMEDIEEIRRSYDTSSGVGLIANAN